MKLSTGLGLLALSLLAVGCGGSNGSSVSNPAPIAAETRGSATLRVIWPNREARLIPLAANSIQIVVSSNGVSVAEALVARPTDGTNETSTTFNDLPVGTLSVSVTAYPNADGTGVGQAVGTGTLTTSATVPATATVALGSTAVSLSISPASPNVGKGTSTTLSASALDADGNTVLLSAGGGDESIVWSVDDTSIATIAGSGPTATLNGLRAGTVQVTARLTIDDSGTVLTGTGTPTVVAASGTVIVQ